MTVIIAEKSTKLNMTDLSMGKGLHLTGEAFIPQLGHSDSKGLDEKVFLTVSVYDTGFGPPSVGQYVSFFINGNPLIATATKESESDEVEKKKGSEKNKSEAIRCAPVQSSGDTACSRGDFVVCKDGYNIDVTSDIQSGSGGSLTLKAISKGVLSSFCPFEEEVGLSTDVYVKFTLSKFVQPTPLPSSMPTPAPTSWTGVVNNNVGLQIGLARVDVWVLSQITFAVMCFMTMLGVGLASMRKKDETVQQTPLSLGGIRGGMIGAELSSLIFLLLTMIQCHYPASATSIITFRVLQMLTSSYYLAGIYGTPQMRQFVNVESMLAKEHMVLESKVYTLVIMMMIIDSSFIVFLPWKKSNFAELSKGFPDMKTYQVIIVTTLLQGFVAVFSQIPFLSGSAFNYQTDFMSVINIIIVSVKMIFLTNEFVMKRTLLATAATAVVEGGDDRLSRKSATANDEFPHGGSVEEAGIESFYTENPLNQTGAAGDRVSSQTYANGSEDTTDRASLLMKVAEAEKAASKASQEVHDLKAWVMETLGIAGPATSSTALNGGGTTTEGEL
jgi:hypothetical protein